MEPPSKRRRLSNNNGGRSTAGASGRSTPQSLSHPVSPPRRRNRLQATPAEDTELARESTPSNSTNTDTDTDTRNKTFQSPFQLTWIRDLPDAANTDAITLGDILGDPLIAECWNFNYLHDIDFLLSHLDQDVRHLVIVHVVHGFWKNEDPNRILLQERAAGYKNVVLHCASMPEMFGTHHSKMLILFRHDDTAQVIIHTANMIARDWTNMTQSVWRSPLLPLLKEPQVYGGNGRLPEVGSGERFKMDLINYLREYDRRRIVCAALAEKLGAYDFAAIRGALIASVPGRHIVYDDSETKWGWAGLKQALRTVPVQEGKSEIVVQVSSIATLGPTDMWLQRSMFNSLRTSKNMAKNDEVSFKVVFPTPDEIRRSLDGYESGRSIHTKIQSAQQAKQLLYLKPVFCHWANDAPRGRDLEPDSVIREAGRKRAAPHIKTYIRYGEKSIDWALTTSANLSKQAWGEAASGTGEMRIASWEIGVLVWPTLFAEEARMVGTFQKDTPDREEEDQDAKSPVVGLRIPYNLPLQSYGADEKPWVATATYAESDWQGRTWAR